MYIINKFLKSEYYRGRTFENYLHKMNGECGMCLFICVYLLRN